LYKLQAPEPLPEGDHHYIVSPPDNGPERSGPLAMASNGSQTPQSDWSYLRNYDDTKYDPLPSKSYKSHFTSLTIVPFVRLDNYTPKNTVLELVKVGAYLYANDLLDKTGFFVGAALNSKFERDLFLNAHYAGKIPLLYQIGLEPTATVELYNVTRKTNNFLTLGVDTIPVDVGYDLTEFDFSLTQPLVSQFSNIEFRYVQPVPSIVELPSSCGRCPGPHRAICIDE
jgi:hypothetical protein